MADFTEISQQYMRALTTAHRVAKKHGAKVGRLGDRVIQDKNRIQIHAKKAIVVDPEVLASFSARAKQSQEKLKKILNAKVVLQPRTIKPVFLELTKDIDSLINVTGAGNIPIIKLPKGLGRIKTFETPKFCGTVKNVRYGSIAAIDVNDPGADNPKGGKGKIRG